jgi:uncharacterized protein (DUF983 family)
MIRLIRIFWDGLLARCPRCHRGRMFGRGFTMNLRCPNCGLPFERAAGEITGGMGINISLTLAIILLIAPVIGFVPSIPLVPSLLALMVFAIVFPIAFYRSSRGLWVSILYLTGDNDEPDDVGLASNNIAQPYRADQVVPDGDQRERGK